MSRIRSKNLFFIFLSAFLVISATTAVFQYTQSYYKYFQTGKRYFIKEKYQRSLGYFEAAYKHKPESLELLQFLAWNYSKLDNQSKTSEMLAKVVELTPDDYKSRIWLGDIYWGLNDYSKAEEVYHKLLQEKYNISVLKKLAEVLVQQGKFESAFEILKRLEKIAPQNESILKLLAGIYSEKGDFIKAEELYKRLVKIDRTENYSLKLAEMLAWQKKYEEAARLLEQTINDGDYISGEVELLGDIYCWQKNYGRSKDMYYKALSMELTQAKRKEIILKLADVFRYTNCDAEAIKLYSQYLDPENDDK